MKERVEALESGKFGHWIYVRAKENRVVELL